MNFVKLIDETDYYNANLGYCIKYTVVLSIYNLNVSETLPSKVLLQIFSKDDVVFLARTNDNGLLKSDLSEQHTSIDDAVTAASAFLKGLDYEIVKSKYQVML